MPFGRLRHIKGILKEEIRVFVYVLMASAMSIPFMDCHPHISTPVRIRGRGGNREDFVMFWFAFNFSHCANLKKM